MRDDVGMDSSLINGITENHQQGQGAGAAISPSADHPEEAAPVLLGCIRLPKDRPRLLWTLCIGVIFSAIAFSTLQEWVFRVPGFRYGGWMTLWMYITYFFCSAIERMITRDTLRKGALKHYALVAMLSVSAVYLTNWSVAYISYATRMVIKSSRILPVMLIGVLLQRKKYSWQEFAAAGLFGLGVAVFTIGESKSTSSTANNSMLGVAILLAAVLADAYTANFEEKHFFRIATPASGAEVMYFLSGFAVGPAVAMAVLSGEFVPAARHSMEHPYVVPGIVLFSTMGYLSICLILLLIMHFDATLSEIVKSTRKVMQVLLSFAVYRKPLSSNHIFGGAAVAVALWWLRRTEVEREEALLMNKPLHHHPSAEFPSSISSSSSSSSSRSEVLVSCGGPAAATHARNRNVPPNPSVMTHDVDGPYQNPRSLPIDNC